MKQGDFVQIKLKAGRRPAYNSKMLAYDNKFGVYQEQSNRWHSIRMIDPVDGDEGNRRGDGVTWSYLKDDLKLIKPNKMHCLKEGQRVTILGKTNTRIPMWNSDMMNYIGKEGVIDHIDMSDNSARVSFPCESKYWFAPDQFFVHGLTKKLKPEDFPGGLKVKILPKNDDIEPDNWATSMNGLTGKVGTVANIVKEGHFDTKRCIRVEFDNQWDWHFYHYSELEIVEEETKTKTFKVGDYAIKGTFTLDHRMSLSLSLFEALPDKLEVEEVDTHRGREVLRFKNESYYWDAESFKKEKLTDDMWVKKTNVKFEGSTKEQEAYDELPEYFRISYVNHKSIRPSFSSIYFDSIYFTECEKPTREQANGSIEWKVGIKVNKGKFNHPCFATYGLSINQYNELPSILTVTDVRDRGNVHILKFKEDINQWNWSSEFFKYAEEKTRTRKGFFNY